MRRFNGTCKACRRRFSALCKQANEIASLPSGIVFAGMYLGAHAYVFVDVDGYKHLGADGGTIARVCDCGRDVPLKPVRGILSHTHKCSDKCRSATGYTCECECGGKNHGAAHG